MSDWKNSGYAIYTVLSIIVLIMISVTIVLRYSSFKQQLLMRELFRLKALYAAESGVERAKYLLSGNEEKTILWTTDGYEEKIDDESSFRIKVRRWGGYIEVLSEGHFLKQKRTLRALLAQKPEYSQTSAITLIDSSADLTIAGSTQIIGDVFLYKGDLRESRIPSMPLQNKEYLRGKVKRIAKERLANLNTSLLDELLDQFIQYFEQAKGADEVIKHSLIFDSPSADFLHYRNKTIYVEGLLEINLENAGFISGPITFIVEQGLNIGKNTKLNNVTFIVHGKTKLTGNVVLNNLMLFSEGTVSLHDNAIVKGQVLSYDSIVAGNRAKINYPSFVYCRPKHKPTGFHGGVWLKDSVDMKGTLVLNPEDGSAEETAEYGGWISANIEKDVIFEGVIYCNAVATLQNKVNGHVTSKGIVYKAGVTTYKNWLVEGKFNREGLRSAFTVPVLFGQSPELITMLIEEN